jgi:hypothetical protein
MKKFGKTDQQEEKELLEKRKQKFGNVGGVMVNEDE